MKWFVVYVRGYDQFEIDEFDLKQQAEALIETIMREHQLGRGTQLLAVIHGTRAEYDTVEVASAVRIR